MMTLANPANSGVANRNIIKVPCMVNISLYCLLLTTCSPGWASSARTTMARSPASEKKPKAAIRYR